MPDIIVSDTKIMPEPSALDLSPTVGLEKIGTQIQNTKTDIAQDTKKIQDNRTVLVQDFIKNIQNNPGDLSNIKMIPTFNMLNDEQKIQLDSFKKSSGLDFIKSNNPGAILDGIQAKAKASLNSLYMPPQLRSQASDPNNFIAPTDNPGSLTQTGINNVYAGKVDGFYAKYKDTIGISNPKDTGTTLNGECVSLAVRFARESLGKEIGGFPWPGGPQQGWDSWGKKGSTFDPKSWDRVEKGKGQYEVGDLVIQGAATTGRKWGHIAVVTSPPDKDGNFKIMESNWNVKHAYQSPVQLGRTVNIKDTLGTFRAKGGATPTKSAPQPVGQPVSGPQSGSVSSVQQIINKFSGGKSPLTAQDYLNASKATGVPVDALLAQGALESGFGTKGVAVKTKNVGNVGNTDSGATESQSSWYNGLLRQATLLSKEYNYQGGFTADKFIASNFVRPRGGRYASDPGYKGKYVSILNQVRSLLK